jgi:hypothetical protein
MARARPIAPIIIVGERFQGEPACSPEFDGDAEATGRGGADGWTC